MLMEGQKDGLMDYLRQYSQHKLFLWGYICTPSICCNIHAKYIKDTTKALGGAGFTISAIIQYEQWSRIGLVIKNDEHLSKFILSSLNFHMHNFNMSVTYQ